MHRQATLQGFSAVLIFVLLLIFAGRAEANSAPPPAVVWFYIDREPGETAAIEGTQLWGCADEVCEQPVLLQTWGTCSVEGCLPGEARMTATVGNIPYSFECAASGGETRCRSAAFEYGQPFFRLAVASGGRLWLQPDLLPLPKGYGATSHFDVQFEADTLVVASTTVRPAPKLPVPPFFAFFGISIVIELVVAGIYSTLRWKLDTAGTIQRLVLVALINMLTYPVVWGFFPTLLRWSSSGNRSAGWGLLAFMLLASGLLWGIINAGSNRRRAVWIGVTAVIVLAALLCLFLSTFASFYGNYRVTASGLPTAAVLLLAEGYAILVEGLLLHGFTRREIPLKEAMLLSSSMNLASFILGLILAW